MNSAVRNSETGLISRANLGRLLWVALLVGHTPALLDAGYDVLSGDFVGLSRFWILAASQIVFLLKLFDAPFLRMPSERRVYLIVAVAVALLHAGPIHRALDHSASSSDEITPITVLAFVLPGLALAIRLIKRVAVHHLLHDAEFCRRAFLSRLDLAEMKRVRLALAIAPPGLRAPPFSTRF